MISRNTAAIIAVSFMGVAALGVTVTQANSVSDESVATAATDTTIYCAIHEDTLGSYTLKYNIHLSSDGTSDWVNADMTDTGYTYNGYYRVYSASFTDSWNGLAQLQFQLYNGTNWVEQDQVFSSWVSVSDYNGKMHVYVSSGSNSGTWIDYTYDGGTATTVYYAIDSTSLGSYTPKINICYGTYSTDAWYAKDMTNTGKTYNGYLIYSVSFTDQNNGLGTLQFQLYSGSTWISQTAMFTSTWTEVATYNGKMFVHGDTSLSWIDYLDDDGRELVTGTFYAIDYSWSTFYAYVWQYHTAVNYALGTWPGTAFTAVSGVTVNGSAVIKVTFQYYNNDPNVSLIVTANDDSNQSDTLAYVENGYVYHTGSAWVIDSDIGAAADLIVDIKEAMGSATVDGTSYSSSICAISDANRTSFVSRYNALGTSAKTYFDAASINTYDPSNLSSTTAVTGETIIAQFSAMGSSSSSSFSLSNLTEDSNAMYILVTLLVIASLGCAAAVVIRSRKRRLHQ